MVGSVLAARNIGISKVNVPSHVQNFGQKDKAQDGKIVEKNSPSANEIVTCDAFSDDDENRYSHDQDLNVRDHRNRDVLCLGKTGCHGTALVHIPK